MQLSDRSPQRQRCGGIGFLHDEVEKSVKVFELLSVDDQPLHFLIQNLERFCRENRGVEYIEADVNAYAPQMQQTFLECGFLPCGYLPALVFHEVERLDAVRMSRLLVPPEIPDPEVIQAAQPLTQHVLRQFRRQGVVPIVAEVIGELDFFDGMTDEQAVSLAEICSGRGIINPETNSFGSEVNPRRCFLYSSVV